MSVSALSVAKHVSFQWHSETTIFKEKKSYIPSIKITILRKYDIDQMKIIQTFFGIFFFKLNNVIWNLFFYKKKTTTQRNAILTIIFLYVPKLLFSNENLIKCHFVTDWLYLIAINYLHWQCLSTIPSKKQFLKNVRLITTTIYIRFMWMVKY